MEDINFKKVLGFGIILTLLVLSFLILKPFLLSIIIGIILAFIFSPIYLFIYKKIHSRNISAIIVCGFLITLFLLPMWFLTPIVLEQSFRVFQASQKIDFVTPLQKIFPSFFASDEFSMEIGSILHSFITRIINSLTNSFADIILNFPIIFLNLIIIFFTFFYLLKDKDLFISYLHSLIPFSKNIEKELFQSSKEITYSVIYGQIVIGLLQGILVGIGFFLFKVPNALFLTILAGMAGILPMIGTAIIWIPVALYLLLNNNPISFIGVICFGIFSSVIDNFLRPLIISRKTRMHPAIALVGMIGGVFLFGVIGFILGPLILAYFFIILELYRNKKTPGIFLSNKSPQKNFVINLLK